MLFTYFHLEYKEFTFLSYPIKQIHAQRLQNNHEKSCKICSKLTVTATRHQLHYSGVFIANFEHISHTFSIVDFEQVNDC